MMRGQRQKAMVSLSHNLMFFLQLFLIVLPRQTAAQAQNVANIITTAFSPASNGFALNDPGLLFNGRITDFTCFPPNNSPLELSAVSGTASIAQGIRVYANTNDPNYDPINYVVEGRIRNDPWTLISRGTFDSTWTAAPPAGVPIRNFQNTPINSSYLTRDTSLSGGEAFFPTNPIVSTQYRVRFEVPRAFNDPSIAYGFSIG